VAVFEKLAKDDEGWIEDDLMKMDPWMNELVRQKPILDELEDFSRWFEAEYKRHCEAENIPENEREKLNLIDEVMEAKVNEKKKDDALGIPCGNLTQEMNKRLVE
jgi:hypothetical protein